MLGTYSYAWCLLLCLVLTLWPQGQRSKVRVYGKFRAYLLIGTYFQTFSLIEQSFLYFKHH